MGQDRIFTMAVIIVVAIVLLAVFYKLIATLKQYVEIKKREEYELETVERIHATLGTASWKIWYDEKNNITKVYWSEGIRKMLGFTDIGDFSDTLEAFINRIHPDDFDKLDDNVNNRILAHGSNMSSFSYKYRLRRKDGEYRWCSMESQIFRRANGTVKMVYGVLMDVNDLEEALRGQADALEAMDSIHNALGSANWEIDFDNESNILECKWSERCKTLLEIDNSEELPNTLEAWEERIHPDDKAGVLKRLNDFIQNASGEVLYDIDYRMLTGKNKYKYYRATGSLSRRNDGSAKTFYGILFDIDESKKREQEERDSFQNLIIALTKIYSDVYMINTETGNFISNRRSAYMEEKYADSFAQGVYSVAIGIYKNDQVFEEDKHLFDDIGTVEKCLELLKEKDEYFFGYRILRNGEIHYYQCQLVIPSRERNEIFIGFKNVDKEVEARDALAVREEKYVLALKEAYNSAEQASKAKSIFLQNMSHDIRTPMNAIIGMTAIAAANIDNHERVRDCLTKTTVASKHLLSIINEVLDMSKIESGKINLIEEEFSLSELIDELVAMVRPQIEEHRHEFEINIHDVKHELVAGDPLRIQQIFVNLCGNAIKYTPDGGRITVDIRESHNENDKFSMYEFSFSDTGIGIEEDFIEKIFEPFARAESSYINNIQGTGLGMPIARSVARMMGGDISVESEVGKGSVFTVAIKLKLQEAGFELDDIANDMPILMVDDDEDSVSASVLTFNEMGINVIGAYSGREAINIATEYHANNKGFFAIFIDWKMPGMNGVETTANLRKILGNEVPIIILSAYDWSLVESDARKVGVTDFINKPLFKSKIVQLFRTIEAGGNLSGDPATEEPITTLRQMNLSSKRCLVVEDNKMNAEIAIELLGMTGMKIDSVSDGAEAISTIENTEDGYYDIIFMDIRMPKVNGYDATMSIRSIERQYCKDVPIIAMTANAFADDIQAAYVAGMNDHIAKPLKLKHLVSLLKKYFY